MRKLILALMLSVLLLGFVNTVSAKSVRENIPDRIGISCLLDNGISPAQMAQGGILLMFNKGGDPNLIEFD